MIVIDLSPIDPQLIVVVEEVRRLTCPQKIARVVFGCASCTLSGAMAGGARGGVDLAVDPDAFKNAESEQG